MKRLFVALALSSVLLGMIIVGVNLAAPALLVPAVCAWTPAQWFLCWTFLTVGGRLRSPIELPSK